jgi:putative ABC transport system permease protein
MSSHHPPRWLERVLERSLPKGLSGQGTVGDLAESFDQRAQQSPMWARLWYARQACSILAYRMVARRDVANRRGDSDLLLDVRWSIRTIIKHPGFSLGIIVVLGLGLGVNVAVFAVLDGTLANTTWWRQPERTVAIWPGNEFSFGQIELYTQEQAAYRAVGGYTELAFALQTANGESQSVNGALITPQIFRELAVQPQLGRALADEDAALGVEPVVVIGDGLWRRVFGADPSIIGRRITISGVPVTVVGVQGVGGLAPGGRAELWFPLVVDPRNDDFWKAQIYRMVGALRPGASLDDAGDDLMRYTRLLSTMFPGFFPVGYGEGVATVTRADEAQRRLIETPLLLLFAGTGVLLLVTALNVGNLLLGRSINRRRELAVRASLGATKGRIVRQLLVEGLALTALALSVGLVTASVAARWIAGLFVTEVVVADSSILSPTVLAFSVGVAALAWLVLNGVPIAHFLRAQHTGLSTVSDTGTSVQRVLVAVQAALATLLLISATLLVATVDHLRQIPLGFDADGLVTIELSPPEDRVASVSSARELYDRVVRRVAAVPSVRAAGLTGWLPLRKQAPTTPINLEAAPLTPREAIRAPMHMVDPGFFDAMGITPLDGRLLNAGDRADAPSAIVVNQTLASMLWPDGSAVGQRIAIDPHAWMSFAPVVGVIPDVRSGEITAPVGPALYVSLAESPSRDVTLIVRTEGAPATLVPTLRRTLREVDALVPIRIVSSMNDVVRAAYATAWVIMGLLIVLAGLATGLGAIGIYAVLTQHVAMHQREIGVRMALGAGPQQVVGDVVQSGLVVAGVGIVIGSGVAAISTRFLESLLFEVSAFAPWAYVASALALSAAAALAAWVPAARAGRLPPAQVLRNE